MTQFRIIVGSYEHTIQCLSVNIPESNTEDRIAHFHTIFHFQAHSLSVRSLDVGKRFLVSGSNDEHIRIYDLQKRKELGGLLQHQGSITKLVFSDEGAKVKDEQFEYLSHKRGRWLLSAAEDGKILIWRVKDWEQFGVLKGHKGSVNDLSIHPSGRVAISISSDRTLRLWNLMTARKASVLKLRGKVTLGQIPYFCKFDHSGEHFIVGLTTRLLIYKTRDTSVRKLFLLKKTLMCMEFLKLGDMEYLILGENDGSLCFYDFKKMQEAGEAKEEKKEKKKGEDEDSESGSDEDSDSDDNDEVSSEIQIGEPEFKLQGHATRVKDMSIYQEKRLSDGKVFTYIVSISSDGRIVIWDMDVKDQVAVYATGERLNVVSTVQEAIEHLDEPLAIHSKAAVSEAESEEEEEEEEEQLTETMKRRRGGKGQKTKKRKLLKVSME